MSDASNRKTHAALSAEVIEMPIGREVTIEHLETKLDLTYNWGYEKARQDLRDLNKKAQRSQWQADVTLSWNTSVDLEHPHYPEQMFPLFGTDIYNKRTEREKTRLGVEMFSWVLSQFMHGEQGALLAAAQLVTTVPDMDSKYYASTQVYD